MTVTSPEFRTDLELPPQYTCAGAGLSPPLYWSGALSQQPKSFAVVVDDGQAPITPYVYWIVFDISPNTTAIAQNRLPPGARQAQNSAGTARYDPPCPGDNELHTYRFTVYALNAWLKLPDGAGLRDHVVSDSQARDRRGTAHRKGQTVAEKITESRQSWLNFSNLLTQTIALRHN